MFKSASNSSLKAIDAIYNSGLKLAIGAFRSSPIVSIYNLAGEYLPEIKRTDSALKYMARLARANCSPLTKESTEIHQELKANDIITSRIITREPTFYPPWLAHYAINTELTSFLKSQTPHSIFRSHFLSILEQYKDYQKVYNDASKSHDEVGFSIIFQNRNILFKLPRACSIFSAEAIAILEAVKRIMNDEHPKHIIFSDSLSTLNSIKIQFQPGDIATKIQNKLYEASSRNKSCSCGFPAIRAFQGTS
jgi:hypothetical protein